MHNKKTSPNIEPNGTQDFIFYNEEEQSFNDTYY